MMFLSQRILRLRYEVHLIVVLVILNYLTEGKHFEKHGREGLDAPQGRSGVGTNVSTLYFVCDNLDVGLG